LDKRRRKEEECQRPWNHDTEKNRKTQQKCIALLLKNNHPLLHKKQPVSKTKTKNRVPDVAEEEEAIVAAAAWQEPMSLHFLRQSAATRLMNLMSPQDLWCKKNSQKLHHHHHYPLRKLFFLASVVVEPRRTVVWQKRRSGNPANCSSNRSCKANKGSEEGEDVGVVGRTQEHDMKKLSCCCYAGGDGWCEEEKEEEETQFEEQQQNVEEFAQDDDDNDDAWDVVVEDEDVQLLAKFRTM